MKTRKELNEIASKLSAGVENPGTVKDILLADVRKHFNVFVEAVKAKVMTAEEKAGAMKPVLSALAVYNDEMRMERIESLKTMKHKEAMAEYIRTQNCSGLAVKEQKEGGYALEAIDCEVEAYDLLTELCPTEIGGIVDYSCVVADNLVRAFFRNEEGINKETMSQGYREIRARKGWDIDPKNVSNRVLSEQLTEVCNMITAGQAPKMISPDVIYLQAALVNAISKADSAGKLAGRNERTIIRFIFRAMYTRINKKAYDFQNKTRSVKENPHTLARNAEMGEGNKEFKPEVQPEATETTTEKKPAKKSGTKKSDK